MILPAAVGTVAALAGTSFLNGTLEAWMLRPGSLLAQVLGPPAHRATVASLTSVSLLIPVASTSLFTLILVREGIISQLTCIVLAATLFVTTLSKSFYLEGYPRARPPPALIVVHGIILWLMATHDVNLDAPRTLFPLVVLISEVELRITRDLGRLGVFPGETTRRRTVRGAIVAAGLGAACVRAELTHGISEVDVLTLAACAALTYWLPRLAVGRLKSSL